MDHFDLYRDRCMELNIAMNDQAIPPLSTGVYVAMSIPWSYILILMITSSQRQTTLDGTFTTQKRVAPFSKRGLIDHLVELVVTEDEAFQLVDKPTFRQLLYYLHPTLPKGGIPHRTKIHDEILARAAQAKVKVKAILQVRPMFTCHVKC